MANRCAVPRYPRVSDKANKSNEQVDCDHTRGITVDRQLPRIITFREDNSNVGTCPDPLLLPRAKGLVPRLTSHVSQPDTITVSSKSWPYSCKQSDQSMYRASLVPRPETARRKGPGFYCLRMRLIICNRNTYS